MKSCLGPRQEKERKYLRFDAERYDINKEWVTIQLIILKNPLLERKLLYIITNYLHGSWNSEVQCRIHKGSYFFKSILVLSSHPSLGFPRGLFYKFHEKNLNLNRDSNLDLQISNLLLCHWAILVLIPIHLQTLLLKCHFLQGCIFKCPVGLPVTILKALLLPSILAKSPANLSILDER